LKFVDVEGWSDPALSRELDELLREYPYRELSKGFRGPWNRAPAPPPHQIKLNPPLSDFLPWLKPSLGNAPPFDAPSALVAEKLARLNDHALWNLHRVLSVRDYAAKGAGVDLPVADMVVLGEAPVVDASAAAAAWLLQVWGQGSTQWLPRQMEPGGGGVGGRAPGRGQSGGASSPIGGDVAERVGDRVRNELEVAEIVTEILAGAGRGKLAQRYEGVFTHGMTAAEKLNAVTAVLGSGVDFGDRQQRLLFQQQRFWFNVARQQEKGVF
jgi:hypothetical protein